MDKRVLHVACGVWHTAAVAAEPIGGSSPLPMSKLSYLEGEAILQKLSAAYAMLDEVRCHAPCLQSMACPVLYDFLQSIIFGAC